MYYLKLLLYKIKIYSQLPHNINRKLNDNYVIDNLKIRDKFE